MRLGLVHLRAVEVELAGGEVEVGHLQAGQLARPQPVVEQQADDEAVAATLRRVRLVLELLDLGSAVSMTALGLFVAESRLSAGRRRRRLPSVWPYVAEGLDGVPLAPVEAPACIARRA